MIAAIMSVIATIFVVGTALSYPAGVPAALLLSIIAVVLPIIGYLYTARWYIYWGRMLDR